MLLYNRRSLAGHLRPDYSKMSGAIGLFLRASQRSLTGEHHRGAASAEPGVVVRTFGTDNATNRHEETAISSLLAAKIEISLIHE